MDFGALPPEINSARIYAGPGSAPMTAAASAWGQLAAELASAASAYQSAINSLVSEGWLGPASTAMAAAAMPYVTWMSGTAAQAELTANQAKAAAAAFNAAHAATVPPPLIVANRSKQAMLVATNFLGQNTPAIAAAEAQYGQMWAQDAAAMYGYATASAAAAQLTPFSAARQTTNPAAQTAPAAAAAQAAGNSTASGTQSTLSQLISATPSTLQAMASPAQPGPIDPIIGQLAGVLGLQPGDLSNALTNLASSSFSPMSLAGITQVGADAAVIHSVANGGVVGPFGGVIPGWGEGLLSPAGISPDLLTPGAGISALGPGSVPGMGGLVGQLNPVSAAVGRGSLVGALSVPQGWTAATPLPAPPAAASGSLVASWSAAPPAAGTGGAPGMPGMPMAGGGAGRGYGFATPRYGFKPTVMGRPVVAG